MYGAPLALPKADAAVEGETQEDLFKKVLARYPECPAAELPPLPKKAAKWREAEFEIFVSTMGCVVPTVEETPCNEGEVDVSPIAAGESVNDSQIKGLKTADACLAIPSQIYMEDRAPAGLKLEAILTKFDRCRAAALQSICGVNLRILADDYGVGILLSDLSIVMDAKPPPLISAADVESEIDLPKIPLVPSRQRLVDFQGEDVCHASFGQLMVDLATRRLSQNEEAYKRLSLPCNRIFGREVPNSVTEQVRKDLAAKLSDPWPAQGRLFTPQKYYKGRYVIPPSDCDTYNTVYHPKVATICEHACLSVGELCCLEETTAFYSAFINTLPPGLRLIAHIFVDAADTQVNGTRVLYVFEEDGNEGSVALSTFAVYGGPLPGTLYQEEVQAVNKKTAQALIKWTKEGTWSAPGVVDLSGVEKQ